jgi:hypothetical protein
MIICPLDLLVGGRFVKYANTKGHSVPDRYSSDKALPYLTERYFMTNIPPPKKPRQETVR